MNIYFGKNLLQNKNTKRKKLIKKSKYYQNNMTQYMKKQYTENKTIYCEIR